MPSDYESQSVKTDTQAERIAREEEVKKEAEQLKEQAAAKKESAKEKAKKNADHPVVIGNAVGLAIIGGVVGLGAYRQYARGELTGKVVAAWAAAVGLFGVGDYYVSQYVEPFFCMLQLVHVLIFRQILLQAQPPAINIAVPSSSRIAHHSMVTTLRTADLTISFHLAFDGLASLYQACQYFTAS